MFLMAVQRVCAASQAGTAFDFPAFDFKQDVFHVWLAPAKGPSIFHVSDVLLLTGHLEESGGVVTAKCQNDTETHKCSHSIQFSESWCPHPTVPCVSSYSRNISVTLDGQVLMGK